MVLDQERRTMNESQIGRRQLLETAASWAAAYSTFGPLLITGRSFSGDERAERRSRGLIGYWPLRGDCRDRSGLGNHGQAHGGAENGQFDGRGGWIEIPPSDSLRLGSLDFTMAAWVWTAPDI